MGIRSRRRRARRAWIVPLFMPLLRAVAERVRRADRRRAYRLGLLLGVLFRWVGLTRETVRRNLELACGRRVERRELRRFCAGYCRHLGLLLVEFLRLPAITRENLDEYFDPAGHARTVEVYREGRGVIFATGHAGHWELAGHLAGLLGFEILSVAKLSGFPELDAFVTGIRESGGQRIRDVHRSLFTLKRTLDRGQAVGINVDQEARKGITFAPFFGIQAATTSAPAFLHLKTGAPILVVTASRRGPFRYRLDIDDEIRHAPTGDRQADLEAITARINAALEAALRRAPDQWLWSHRRWRRRPTDEAVPFARVTDAPGLDPWVTSAGGGGSPAAP